MQRTFTEGTILFISVLKWFLLASCIGIIVGSSTYLFLEILKYAFAASTNTPYYFLFLPLAFFTSSLIIKYISKDAGGYGTEKIIEAVHKNSGKIKAFVVPAKLLATIITLAAGGSVGKVGPSAQIGAGLSSIFAGLFGFSDTDRKKLVIRGISAGFAAVFGAPIAGAIFGIEVLFVGALMYDVLLPSFVAGIVAFQVSSSLGTTYIHHAVDFAPVFSESFFIIVAISGIFFGLCSYLLIEAMKRGKKFSSSIKIWPPFKALIGGCILVALVFLFSTDYLGLGEETIRGALAGEEVVWYAFLMKIVFTVITFSSGGTGGVITPIFFIGATAGAVFAMVLGLNIATFSAIGFVSLLAGAVNTPITGSILALEFFGPEIGSYAAVACIVSFLITGHRSIFSSQLVALKKSASIDLELGKEVENITPIFKERGRSVMEALLWARDKVKVKYPGKSTGVAEKKKALDKKSGKEKLE